MYCLSKDGLKMTEATGFVVAEVKTVVRYYENGEPKYNNPGDSVFCIFTNNGYLMDAFKKESGAVGKLKEVMAAIAAGVSSFEF